MKTNSQAEVKPFKVGEPLTDQADGNPEPSMSDSSDKACVETRRRVCKKCGNEIPLTKYKSAIYCSNRCRSTYVSYRAKVRQGKFKKPGVGSGGNQVGTDNHMYKTGIGGFSKRAMDHYGKICNRCGSLHNLVVHHRDHDRTNNVMDNFEVLCKRCHQGHHAKRDEFGRYTKG